MNFVVWQLIDSGFPSGGFAHSAGLEASVQHGHVASMEDVCAFSRRTLAQAGRASLPLVAAAHRQPGDLSELDELSDVFLSNPVANRASRAQGRALLTGAVRSFERDSLSILTRQVRDRRLATHHAPVFGAVFRALDVDLADTARAFLFTGMRSVASAAVRLGLIGGYEAQQIQAALAADIDEVIQQARHVGPQEIAQTAPLVDLFQSTHDRVYSKLFQS